MDITPFEVHYRDDDGFKTAIVHPCCGENNVVDYAVRVAGKLAFAITRDEASPSRWIVSMKNADETISDDIIQEIGHSIENHYSG